MAKKKKPTTKYKELPRKKGTYYDKNREKMREMQQTRRALIKAGKIVPKTGSKPRNASKKQAVKAVVKKAPKKAAKPVTPKKHKDQRHRTPSKLSWAAEKREKERLANIEEYNKLYPLENE